MAFIKPYTTKRGEKRYRLFWWDPARRKQSKVFKRSRDAERFKRDIEHSIDHGTYTDPARGRMKLAEFWKEFIEAPPRPLATATRNLYSMQARRYILPKLGEYRLNQIQPADVRKFIADLVADGVGLASVNSTYRTLRRLLSAAVADRRIALNPASGLEAPRSLPREMRFMTSEEVRAIAQNVDDRYRVLVLFLAYTGLRIGEASALRVGDLDLSKHSPRVLVVRSAGEVNGHREVKETKTGKKRSIRLPGFLRDELFLHLGKYGKPLDRESPVFTGPYGAAIRENAFRKRAFQPAAARAGVSPIPRVHDLRHTAVAFAIQAGWHPKKIQEMLGHSTITTTLDTYGHLFESLHGDDVDRLDAMYRQGLAATALSGEPDGDVIAFPVDTPPASEGHD